MARSYYSTVFEQPPEQIWAIIRDFSNYTVWIEGVSETFIEEGKVGDQVGAVRNVCYNDKHIRQRLLAHSDRDRYQVYEFCYPIPYPLRHFEATLRVTPIIDGNRAFVEWWATFDCKVPEEAHWSPFFVNSFAEWLESLRAHLTDK